MEPRARSIQQVIERQFRWEILREHHAKHEKPIHWPIITIEREFGARGEALGRILAGTTGFTFWDGELVHTVAGESGADETVLRSLDEHRRSAIEESIEGALLGGQHMSSEYLRRLMKLIHAISAHGGSVVVGRGAQYILAPETVLRVRVVSPLEERVRGYAERHGIEAGRARTQVKRSDAERSRFILQSFSRNSAVAADYDLVVNTGTFTLEQAAKIVLEAYGDKFGRRPKTVDASQLSGEETRPLASEAR